MTSTSQDTARDLFPRAGTFDIIPNQGGFSVVDTCTFNRWSCGWDYIFPAQSAAIDWAWKCHEFKTGRRSTLERPREAV